MRPQFLFIPITKVSWLTAGTKTESTSARCASVPLYQPICPLFFDSIAPHQASSAWNSVTLHTRHQLQPLPSCPFHLPAQNTALSLALFIPNLWLDFVPHYKDLSAVRDRHPNHGRTLHADVASLLCPTVTQPSWSYHRLLIKEGQTRAKYSPRRNQLQQLPAPDI